ncbi:potassium channel family protein [Bacillus alveayuensis]|jgi:potassium channel LctB|uniref:Potassium channel LctB n=1 Tax=Aeribacillus alveayuensis TaxID=279215 RepID=A0ABT9VQ22_9BACI|nr:potassium channel family protein [Bacillus alveayuensis]MDQ0163086.1 potassium channel LctB [Bacillus alveayuensis]
MGIFIGAGVLFCLIMSLKILIKAVRKGTFLSFETVCVIGLVYISFLIGFAMLYLLLQEYNVIVLIENGNELKGSYFEKMESCLYFSAVTLFSVGYGDITPVGIGRWLALIEAFFGYILPTTVVARTVIEIEKGQ